METSFLALDDYPFLQDPDPSFISFSHAKKRPRFENHSSSIDDAITKLLEFDTVVQEKPVDNFYAPHQPSIFIDSNSIYIQEMADTSSYNFDGYPNLSHSGTKRPRAEAGDAATAALDDSSSAVNSRRLWVKNRSKAWWELVDSPNFPEEDFRKAFRMSRDTFNMICEELESVVTKKDTMLRTAIPVRQRVAVCIWRLATGEALRELSKRFGLGISTCHKLVLEVCGAIRNVLMPKFLQWPDKMKMRENKREFESVTGIPNVVGSMYTTHIPIIAPKERVAAYFNKRHTERNQKTSYSITVQGVVDPKGAFTDICIGYPGSMTDDQVLEKSALFQRASRGALRDVWVAGNSSFPLMDWVLVPYNHINLTWAQHACNEKIEELQRVSKESFMRLKGRWRCLQKRTEMKLQDLPVVLAACCVLHNICEMRKEGFSEDLRSQIFDDQIIPENNVRSVNASHARDQIARNLLHHRAPTPHFLL